MAAESELRSELSQAKGLGAAHHGVGHWWLQRVTAVALIPLSLWFMYGLLTAMLLPDPVQVAQWLSSPLHAIATALMFVAGFVHAKLGMQVIIEDYVHHPFWKYTLLLANVFICGLMLAVALMAVLRLHSLDIAAGVA